MIRRNIRSLACLLVLTICGACTPAEEASEGAMEEKKRLQPWAKQGRILAPGFAGPLSSNRLSAPSVVKLKDGRLRLYFWTGDKEGYHYLFAAEASPDNPHDWELLSDEPLLRPSPTGNLSDRGPSFPWVLPREEGGWLMYYAVWGSWAPPGELSNRTSLAISQDEGVTWETIKEPLLPLGEPGSYDAGLTGSVCVLQTGPEKYEMWYTAGERYEIFNERNRGIVHIGHAVSQDGIEWVKDPEPALRARQEQVEGYEAVVSKPSVLIIDGVYHMWFSVFMMDGHGYRLRYARSQDGVHWKPYFDEVLFPHSPGEFDSENQSYSNVIEVGDELWMFYVGNRFGATGIGLATMKTAAL